MKRDVDLIRLLLLRTESGGQYVAQCEQYDISTRAYHVALMKEDGLVEAVVTKDERGLPSKAVIIRMTAKGHQYLDEIRNSFPRKRSILTSSMKERIHD